MADFFVEVDQKAKRLRFECNLEDLLSDFLPEDVPIGGATVHIIPETCPDLDNLIGTVKIRLHPTEEANP